MMTIYFYGSNREIVAENVKKCYSMIEKYGFNAAMGKIKLVDSEDLTGEKLLKVPIIYFNALILILSVYILFQ